MEDHHSEKVIKLSPDKRISRQQRAPQMRVKTEVKPIISVPSTTREPLPAKDKDKNIHTMPLDLKVGINSIAKRETQNLSKKQATHLSEKTDKEANLEAKQLNLPHESILNLV